MATQADFERVLEKLSAHRVGSSWMAHCPAHEDSTASLSVSFENDKILLHCHAGCSQDSVLLKFKPVEVAHYDYLDESGKLLYQVVRFDNLGTKTFRQRRPGTNGKEWIWDTKNVRHVLYHSEELAGAQIVLVTEGEKDVETLRSHGYVATCNAMGAGKWSPEYSEQLRAKHVVIVPDNDEPGAKHAELVARELSKIAASVGVARVPERYKDVSDWQPQREALALIIKYAEQWREEPKDWRLLFHSYEEFEQAPPLSFAIEKFLQNDAITAIAGLPGHGKTFNALSVCKALLRGDGKLWNWFAINERFERIVYLIPESTITPFKHRLKLMGLYEYVENGRLLVRTLSKGPAPDLEDKRLLWAVKGAAVVVDTAIRFVEEGTDDNSASAIANSLSNDLLGLLRAEARVVLALFHAIKGAKLAEIMTLENMIRGTGELGAVLATAWGLKQIDERSAITFVQNLKARDFEACSPFELVMRPSISDTHDIAMLKTPDETGPLHEEQPDMNPRNNAQRKEGRAANIALFRSWIERDPELSTQEVRERFAALGIEVKDATIRGYKHETHKKK